MTEDDGFQTIWPEIYADMAQFGTAFVRTGADGKPARIDPSEVSMAQWKDPIQAARNEALEEAARVAARQVGDWAYITPSARAWHAENVAASIRALKDTPE